MLLKSDNIYESIKCHVVHKFLSNQTG